MAKKKAKKTATRPTKKEKTNAQIALEVTWVIKGQLKRSQLTFLFIGEQLTRVKNENLYGALHHVDVEDYAQKRLGLRRSSLYRYLQVYEWVTEKHKEWLGDKPKGFIPSFDDVGDLMWIEEKLEQKGLTAKTREELKAMREAALKGALADDALSEWRKKGGRVKDALKNVLSSVRAMRRRFAEVPDVPADAMSHIETAIEIIKKAVDERKKNG